jgi:hypothetical protein
MIEIDFPVPSSGQVRLRVKGHSNLAGKGNDIVCAAVSALTQTFAAGVQRQLDGKVNGKLTSGDCDLEIQVSKIKSQSLEEICSIFRFGFEKIKESYPKQVNLI